MEQQSLDLGLEESEQIPQQDYFVLFSADEMKEASDFDFLILVVRKISEVFGLKLAGIPIQDLKLSAEEKEELIGKNVSDIAVVYKRGTKVNLEDVELKIREQDIVVFEKE